MAASTNFPAIAASADPRITRACFSRSAWACRDMASCNATGIATSRDEAFGRRQRDWQAGRRLCSSKNRAWHEYRQRARASTRRPGGNFGRPARNDHIGHARDVFGQGPSCVKNGQVGKQFRNTKIAAFKRALRCAGSPFRSSQLDAITLLIVHHPSPAPAFFHCTNFARGRSGSATLVVPPGNGRGMVARVRLTIFGRRHACHMGRNVAACKETSAGTPPPPPLGAALTRRGGAFTLSHHG